MQASWSFPTSIQIGPGAIASLGEACAETAMDRPLVVTDPGFATTDAFSTVAAVLDREDIAFTVFTGVRPNPTGSNVEAGLHMLRAGGHDGVIAVGGGSALDVAKVMAFAAGQRRPIWDFEDIGDNWRRADLGSILPIIAIPTTAGTGSEVGRAGVIVNEAEQRKVIVFHPKMLPVRVLADPELTVGLPTHLTIGTGMDALSHCLEAVCAPTYHPMAHGIGLEGCRLVLEHLPRVVDDPGDLDSRTHMMTAAAMGAVAFQKGLGAMHSLSHPIGTHFGTHHGMTNALFMPYVLEANIDAIEDVLTQVASHARIAGGPRGLIAHIVEMRASLGVPHTLGDLGVDGDLSVVVREAPSDPTAATNPVPVTPHYVETVLHHAATGTLKEV